MSIQEGLQAVRDKPYLSAAARGAVFLVRRALA